MLWSLVILPALCGLGCVLIPQAGWRRALLVLAGLAHLALTVGCAGVAAADAGVPPPGRWLALDSLALLFLGVTDVLFILAGFYTFAYLDEKHDKPGAHGFLSQEALFPSLLLLFLSAMSLGILSQHCVVTWVAVEATTLVTASLICYHRSARSLEAAWKYMLICSVGIAIALAGNMALATSVSFSHPWMALTYDNIAAAARAGELQPLWLKIGFILLLVGYGTKIGLFPMHTWLPDAHSEAPAPVSALLSGTLLNCALLALLRVFAVMNQAGMGADAGKMLEVFGALSVAVAVVFIARQRDFKRLLAYSSIEHMGLITLGMSYSAFSREAASYHVLNHSLAKGLLFLTAGNILTVYGTKTIARVRGMLSRRPGLAVLWLLGLLAICGFPPFGLFVSELWLVLALAEGGRWVLAAGVLLLLGGVFIGMSRSFLRMAGGEPAPLAEPAPLSLLRTAPGWILLGASIWLGLCPPAWLLRLVKDASRIVNGG